MLDAPSNRSELSPRRASRHPSARRRPNVRCQRSAGATVKGHPNPVSRISRIRVNHQVTPERRASPETRQLTVETTGLEAALAVMHDAMEGEAGWRAHRAACGIAGRSRCICPMWACGPWSKTCTAGRVAPTAGAVTRPIRKPIRRQATSTAASSTACLLPNPGEIRTSIVPLVSATSSSHLRPPAVLRTARTGPSMGTLWPVHVGGIGGEPYVDVLRPSLMTGGDCSFRGVPPGEVLPAEQRPLGGSERRACGRPGTGWPRRSSR